MSERGKLIRIYDTTLRDGCQAEGMSLSVADKLEVAQRLDELGVHYIEGGFAGAYPKDEQFFREARSLGLKTSRLAAFGATRRKKISAAEDPGLKALLAAETPVVCIVGKSWDYHVTDVIRTTLDENLLMVEDSVRFLKAAGREVIMDAEHFFDGCADNAEYALKVVRVAAEAGADCVVLCDTNGGALPDQVGRLTAMAVAQVRCPVGIHCHNDCGLAVANSLAAVQTGAVHVQGTINGFGERAGNADLCSIIPIINLKTPHHCISAEQLRKLTEVSRFVYEVANLMHAEHQPFVGSSAFAHKAGLHVDAMRKADAAYEHIGAGAGRQRAPLPGQRTERPRHRAGEGGGLRHRRRPGGHLQARRAAQGARERGLPVRGRRGVLRAAGAPHGRQVHAALRGQGLPRELQPPDRRQPGDRRHREAQRQRQADAHRQRGGRPGQRARRRAAQGPGAATTPA